MHAWIKGRALSWLVDDIGRTVARWTGRDFERATRDPRAAQLQRLKQLVQDRRDTAFGREHDFQHIASPEEYRSKVPMRDYEGFRPYIDRIVSCLLYTSPSPRDISGSRMPSSA